MEHWPNVPNIRDLLPCEEIYTALLVLFITSVDEIQKAVEKEKLYVLTHCIAFSLPMVCMVYGVYARTTSCSCTGTGIATICAHHQLFLYCYCCYCYLPKSNSY